MALRLGAGPGRSGCTNPRPAWPPPLPACARQSRRRSGWQKLLALGAKAVGQPTRVEVDEAFREIQQLKREVRALKRKLARDGATGSRT